MNYDELIWLKTRHVSNHPGWKNVKGMFSQQLNAAEQLQEAIAAFLGKYHDSACDVVARFRSLSWILGHAQFSCAPLPLPLILAVLSYASACGTAIMLQYTFKLRIFQ